MAIIFVSRLNDGWLCSMDDGIYQNLHYLHKWTALQCLIKSLPVFFLFSHIQTFSRLRSTLNVDFGPAFLNHNQLIVKPSIDRSTFKCSFIYSFWKIPSNKIELISIQLFSNTIFELYALRITINIKCDRKSAPDWWCWLLMELYANIINSNKIQYLSKIENSLQRFGFEYIKNNNKRFSWL